MLCPLGERTRELFIACSCRVSSSAVGSACHRPAAGSWSPCRVVLQLFRYQQFSSALWVVSAGLQQQQAGGAEPGQSIPRAGWRHSFGSFVVCVKLVCLIFRTPLHLACANGHADVVRFLVQEKCQLNLADHFKRSPLMTVCGICYALASRAY